MAAGAAGQGCSPGADCVTADTRPVAVPSWDPTTVWPLYDPAQNPFDQPIGPNPVLHPDSDLLATSLDEQFADQGMVLSVRQWTVPVYLADAGTPRHDVEFGARWAPYSRIKDVPIPEWAVPDPSSDGSLVILDLAQGLEYDFFAFCGAGGSSSAMWGNILRLDSPGIFPHGLSARGSGFSLLNGLIWPHELAAGRIDHALLFTFNLTRAGGPVAPATESDGTGLGANNLPEGARVQLDPTLDVTSLGLEPWQQTIAVAMQEYGMFLGDDGGGMELELISPLSYPQGEQVLDGVITLDEYGYGVFPDTFPADRFRVLDFGPQNPDFGETSVVEFPDRFE